MGCVSSRSAFPWVLSVFGSASHSGPGSLFSLLARGPSWVLASLALRLAETAHSPWSPRQVASGALLGSFRAWSGSASCCLGLAEGKASLVLSASLDASPLPLPELLRDVQHMMENDLRTAPQDFQVRIVFMSMNNNNIHWTRKETTNKSAGTIRPVLPNMP